MPNQEIAVLLKKYQAGTATEQEVTLLLSLVQNWGAGDEVDIPEEEFAAVHAELSSRLSIGDVPARQFQPSPRVAAGSIVWKIAAAVAAVTLGVWLYYASSMSGRRPDASLSSRVSRDLNDIAPGRNTATLTLADGKTVNLSDAKSGVVIDASKLTYSDGEELGISSESGPRRGGPEVSSETPQFLGSRDVWSGLREGQAGSGGVWSRDAGSGLREGQAGSRDAGSGLRDGNVGSLVGSRAMSVRTPRGGQYQVILPDGSRVWLNAASSIKFPASFDGAKQRVVELTGEAYFAVRKSPDIPFVVRSHGQETLVLGTEFNVNSYFDEDEVVTTLVNGSLKVSAGNGKSVLLVPGEESRLGRLNLDKREADLPLSTSWKHGTFYFNKTAFDSMMRQVSRWYDVDVVYLSRKVPGIRFTGEIKRDVMLQTVLTYLQDLGVKLRVEGRTLYIE